jgi:hypothetical protein
MKRIDVAAFNVGLFCVGLACLALISAFAIVDWQIVSIVAPLGLVLIGLAGLVLSRTSTKGTP